jgi:hypothetical protein
MYNLLQCSKFLWGIINNETWFFKFGICERSFTCMAFNYSTKFSHVCRFVITQTTGTSIWWKSNAINANKWYSTLFVPNMASIEISPLWLNWSMAWNCVGVSMPMVKGTWIPFSSHASWKYKTSLRWAQTHD